MNLILDISRTCLSCRVPTKIARVEPVDLSGVKLKYNSISYNEDVSNCNFQLKMQHGQIRAADGLQWRSMEVLEASLSFGDITGFHGLLTRENG